VAGSSPVRARPPIVQRRTARAGATCGGRRGRAAIQVAAAGACLLQLLAGCVELKPGSDEVPVASDGSLKGSTFEDPAWSCLDTLPAAEPASEEPQVSFSMPIIESISGLPPAGLQVRACQLLDVPCSMPSTPTPVGPSEDGLVHLSLPRGFTGFLEITSEDTAPALFFMHAALERDTQAEALPLISARGLAALAANNGAELDLQSSGLIVVRTYDCLAKPAGGVELTNDRGGQVFVFVEGLPRVGLTVTDVAGLGGFMNVPPGFVRVTGRHVETGEISGAESLVVRARWLSFGDLQPSDGD
jgi:hypothetical protein